MTTQINQYSKFPHQDVILMGQNVIDTHHDCNISWEHIDTEYGIGIHLNISDKESYQVTPTHIHGHVSIHCNNHLGITEIYNGIVPQSRIFC